MTEEQKRRLFEVYYLCQFGRAVALDSCERAARINQFVSLLALACVAGSPLTGAVAFFAIGIPRYQYGEIMGRTRREYKRYADRHMTRIDQELRQRLQAAGFIKQPDEPGQTARPS